MAAAEALLAHASPTPIAGCTGDRIPAACADLFDKIRFANEGSRKGDKIGPPCRYDFLHQPRRPKSSYYAEG